MMNTPAHEDEVKRYTLMDTVLYEPGDFKIPSGQCVVSASDYDALLVRSRSEREELEWSLKIEQEMRRLAGDKLRELEVWRSDEVLTCHALMVKVKALEQELSVEQEAILHLPWLSRGDG